MNSSTKSSPFRIFAIGTTGAIALGMAAFSPVAMAQNAPANNNVELAQLVPSDVDQYMETNTSVANPLSGIMDSILSNLALPSTNAMDNTTTGSTMSPADAQSLKDILTNEFKSNTLSFAMKQKPTATTNTDTTYQQPDTYVSMNMTADDYNKLTAMFNNDDKTKTDTIDGTTVYDNSTDMYLTMVGNLVVMTNSQNNMTTLLDMYTKKTGTSLAQNTQYQAVQQKELTNSFFNIYMNFAQLQSTAQNLGSNMDNTDLTGLSSTLFSTGKNILSALNAEGLSVAESTNGFNFGFMIKGDAAKLTQLNLNFDRYNFVPQLYKYINPENIIMFSEKNNLQNQIQILENLLLSDPSSSKSFTDWKNQFKADSNIDFDNDLLPLFSGKYAMSIHKTSQIYPAITLMVDVHTMQPQAAGVLANLVNYMNKTMKTMETQQGINFYNQTTVQFNDATYYQMTFDPTKSADTSANIKNISSDKTLLTINAAIDNQGFLVISTAPNINDIVTMDGKGMMNNADFAGGLSNPNENSIGLGFVSFDGIKSYADMLMSTFSADSSITTLVDGLLAPWHDLYTKAYGTTDTAWGSGFVNVDTAGLAKYSDLFTNYFTLLQNSMQIPAQPVPQPTTNLNVKFCDVKSSDWDSQYVDGLAQQGIISGYNDGCFRPNNQITRAEFIKMVMGSNGITQADPNKHYFTDIDNIANISNGQWYAFDIDAAAYAGYIKGYSDGTFRPNAPITRAEAVQILYNMSDRLKQVNNFGSPVGSLIHFNDVKNNDWFMPAIAAADYNGIVSGVNQNSFEPNRNLTRGEAAKLIKLFLDLQNSPNQQGPMIPATPPSAPVPGMLKTINGQTPPPPTNGPNVY